MSNFWHDLKRLRYLFSTALILLNSSIITVRSIRINDFKFTCIYILESESYKFCRVYDRCISVTEQALPGVGRYHLTVWVIIFLHIFQVFVLNAMLAYVGLISTLHAHKSLDCCPKMKATRTGESALILRIS